MTTPPERASITTQRTPDIPMLAARRHRRGEKLVMADGSITKRCGCRQNGKRLGAKCPKLHRGNGWNPHHGSWRYQLELPLDGAGGRRQLRRTGFDTREEAVDERDHARALLDLSGRDEVLRRQIADLLQAVKPNQPLPDRDHVARRIHADMPADKRLTLGDYLAEWIKGRTKLAPATRRSYQDHITNYWAPRLGQVPLQELTVGHIESVFAQIDARNDEIRAAKASPVKEVRDAVKGIRTVGEASQQRILAPLRKALNDARRLDRHKLVDHNPAESVELASGKPPKPSYRRQQRPRSSTRRRSRFPGSTAIAWYGRPRLPLRLVQHTPHSEGTGLPQP
ncbi:hypothetical protein ABGB07_34225 [Micromonosporaceae bacterium B7E4]